MSHTAFVEFSWPTGRARVSPGGILGRASTAALRVDYAGVSEAHALVTLRAGSFRIQALRGEIDVDGQPADDLPLRAGINVTLSPALTLRVERVVIPTLALALSVNGRRHVLTRTPCTLVRLSRLPPLVVPSFRWEALALVDGLAEASVGVLWVHEGDELCVGFTPDQRTPLVPPIVWDLDGYRVELDVVPQAGTPETMGRHARKPPVPLRIAVRYHTVHIWAASHAPIILTGITARLISELSLLGRGPVEWEVVAHELWPKTRDGRLELREKWDKTMQRLRRQLRGHGLREDIVRTDRHGNVEIVLQDGDSLTNESGDDEEVR